jgi:hypothetical protein
MFHEQSPELDDFPCEFYKGTWEFVGPDLLQVYKEALKKHFFGATIN